MSANEFFDTVMSRGIRLATRVCIFVNPYQRALENRFQGVSAYSISRRRSTVMGWWIVASTGQAGALDAEQAVAEGLVVLDHVEVVDPGPQVLPGTDAERQRLREAAPHERRHFDEVAPGLDLPRTRETHREVVVVDVEARQLDEGNALVEDREGLTAEDLDLVPQIDQCLGQMTGVDALSTHVWLAPVAEEGDAEREVAVGSRGHRLPGRAGG